MWKVVAADDEGYIREALKKLINWEKKNEILFEDSQRSKDYLINAINN